MRFDLEVAEAAVDACRAAIAELEATQRARHRAAGEARLDWVGQYRRAFDERFNELDREAARLLAGLTDQIRAVEALRQLVDDESELRRRVAAQDVSDAR